MLCYSFYLYKDVHYMGVYKGIRDQVFVKILDFFYSCQSVYGCLMSIKRCIEQILSHFMIDFISAVKNIALPSTKV